MAQSWFWFHKLATHGLTARYIVSKVLELLNIVATMAMDRDETRLEREKAEEHDKMNSLYKM